ncbi:MAG: hypothetical protein GY934_20485 [Gammaproteobacteria bacterium]|nr:hypothetical protein [Gammaproteobacteria bacterium]
MSNQRLQPLFPLGQQVLTIGAIAVLQQARQRPEEFLKRHQSGDWGEVPVEDARANLQAIHQGLRIISSYSLGGERLWLITEADRRATTVLRSDEYWKGV